MATYRYNYADGSTGDSPWQRDASGNVITNPDGSVREGAFVGTVGANNAVTPGISSGAAMNVMGYGGVPTDGTFVDPATVQANTKPAGAVFGGTDPNKPANGVTTGNNKPMQVGGPGSGSAGGGAVWGGTGGTTPGGGGIGGIINSTAAGLTPWNVTSDQTVAGNIGSVISAGSPLLQQAQTRALQGMNARGIVNSSIASGAAEAALYDAAMPIAQADAALKGKVAGYNADQANQQFSLDKNLANSWNQAQLQSNTTKYTADLQAETQKLNNASQQLIAGLNNEQQITVAKLNNENNRLLNTNRDAATAFNNSMQYINSINSNPNMDAEAKTRAVAQIYYNLDTQLKTLSKTAGIDVRSSLSLANAPGFDAQGNYVGFDKKPANAPAAATNTPPADTSTQTGAGD